MRERLGPRDEAVHRRTPRVTGPGLLPASRRLARSVQAAVARLLRHHRQRLHLVARPGHPQRQRPPDVLAQGPDQRGGGDLVGPAGRLAKA